MGLHRPLTLPGPHRPIALPINLRMLPPQTFHVSVPPKNPHRLEFPREAEIRASTLLELVEQSPLRVTTLVKLLKVNVRTIKSHLEEPGRLRVDEVVTIANQLSLDVNMLFEFIRAEATMQAQARAEKEAVEKAALKAAQQNTKAKASPKAVAKRTSGEQARGKKAAIKSTTRSVGKKPE